MGTIVGTIVAHDPFAWVYIVFYHDYHTSHDREWYDGDHSDTKLLYSFFKTDVVLDIHCLVWISQYGLIDEVAHSFKSPR